jgi:hypothetical protein
MLEPQTENDGGQLFRSSETEKRSLLPWVVAGGVIAVALVLILVFGSHRTASTLNTGPGLAPLDAYAGSLDIGDVHMSEASNFAGGNMTYIDGKIANRGGKTLDAITVQVAFRNDLKEIAQRETMPLTLIRTHEPYVDTEPVSAAPLKPGDEREFRLIFDSVAADWNRQYPEIRVVGTAAK